MPEPQETPARDRPGPSRAPTASLRGYDLAMGRPGHRFVFEMALPRDLPTPNQRLHHFARHSRVSNVRTAVAMQAGSRRMLWRVPEAEPGRRARVRLTLVRGPGQRLLDPDNAVAALKPVLDGLGPVGRPGGGSGWLAGDSPALCRLAVDQTRGDRPGVRVEIERVDR